MYIHVMVCIVKNFHVFLVCILLRFNTRSKFITNLSLTSEVYVQTTELKLDPLQSFSECLMVMANGLLRACAEWQWEEFICLLSVVIWPHCVHPQDNLLSFIILKTKKFIIIKESIKTGAEHEDALERIIIPHGKINYSSLSDLIWDLFQTKTVPSFKGTHGLKTVYNLQVQKQQW